MRIPQIDKLPDLAQRSEWARLLEINPTTLYRAEKRGDLTGSRPTGRSVVYTKAEILRWLGVGRG
jgi:predicted DNA-binding transcriptional regulator AlpA